MIKHATPDLPSPEMDVEARLNEVADHLAHEGLTYRASRVREGAVEIARQRHRIERLEADNAELRQVVADMLAWADTPTQEASPSWIIGACERARAVVSRKEG